MNISYDSNEDLWRAYTRSNIDLWNQNFVNGKYIIAYEFNPSLHQKLQNMLPKVNISDPDFRFIYYCRILILMQWYIKAMEKIEAVTCIKFEDRNKNNHKERVIEMVDCSAWIITWLWNIALNKDFIEFLKGFSCHSLAGRDGGRQYIVLSSYCAKEHILIHEVNSAIIVSVFEWWSFKILHALGFLHEHQRPDRDQYIDVDMAAINMTSRHYGLFKQFRKGCFHIFKIIEFWLSRVDSTILR